MAVTLSKLFMRTISQHPNEKQTGVSLWTVDDIKKVQMKQREEEEEEEEGEEYGDGGIEDEMLVDVMRP